MAGVCGYESDNATCSIGHFPYSRSAHEQDAVEALGHIRREYGGRAILRLIVLCAGAALLSSCASVKVSMPNIPGLPQQASDDDDGRIREREALAEAVSHLERQPWDEGEVVEDSGFVGMIFGRGGTSPRDYAEHYLVRVGNQDPASRVRSDLRRSLHAAWNVAATGREASHAIESIPQDLRMIEEAIVEARHCRLVYTEALSLIAENDSSVGRDEIRAIKDEFNQAILELGRTADVISARLSRTPAQSLAHTDI